MQKDHFQSYLSITPSLWQTLDPLALTLTLTLTLWKLWPVNPP